MMTNMMKTLTDSLPSADDVLHQVGLQRHPPTSGLSVLATFALGGIIGAALVALFTPRTGRALRHVLGERLHAARERITGPMNGDGYGEPARRRGAVKRMAGVVTSE